MRNSVLYLSMIVVIAISGCRDKKKNDPNPTPILLQVDVDDSAPDFEADDRVSLYAWAGSNFTAAQDKPLIIDAAITEYDGEKWDLESPLHWKDYTTPHFFVATHPEQQITDFKKHKCTTISNIDADDLFIAVNDEGLASRDEKAVKLSLIPVKSRLELELNFSDDFKDRPEVTDVSVIAQGDSYVDLFAKRAVPTGDALPISMQFVNQETRSSLFSFYYKLVLPVQTIHTITVTFAGGVVYTIVLDDDLLLKVGAWAYISIELEKENDDINIGSVTVKPWVEGEDSSHDTEIR